MHDNEKIKLLLEHHRDLINKLLKRLRKNEHEQISSEELEELFWYRFYPFFDKQILRKLDSINEKLGNQSFTCRFTQENEGMMRMMIAPPTSSADIKQVRKTGLKEIRDFTKDASELIIIDPYMFGGETESTTNYIDEFKKSTRIDGKSLSKVHIIYSSKHGNTSSIKSGIKNLASDNGCTISSFDTDKVHDRVWIKNQSEAIVVGTSFGGLGNRLCFILVLPDYDLQTLMDYLKQEKYFSPSYT